MTGNADVWELFGDFHCSSIDPLDHDKVKPPPLSLSLVLSLSLSLSHSLSPGSAGAAEGPEVCQTEQRVGQRVVWSGESRSPQPQILPQCVCVCVCVCGVMCVCVSLQSAGS